MEKSPPIFHKPILVCCMLSHVKFYFVRGALRKFPVAGVCKMNNQPISLSERIQAFTRDLALSLRRITGRVVELDDLPPVVQPVKDQEDVGARDE
jgi:hypothetical protein